MLATLLKATAQWFATDLGTQPSFVVQAERYLAEGPHDRPITASWAAAKGPHRNLRTGPVVKRKNATGANGRLHALAELTHQTVRILEAFNEADLPAHIEAHRDGIARRSGEPALLPNTLAGGLFSALAHGTFAQMLQEQHFQLKFDKQFSDAAAAIATDLNLRGIAPGKAGAALATTLESRARRLLSVGLKAIGVRVPKDLFRDRRAAL